MSNLRDRFNALPKDSRRNIIMMIILMVMFIIGIIIRWDYIGGELKGTTDTYKELFTRDSIQQKGSNTK